MSEEDSNARQGRQRGSGVKSRTLETEPEGEQCRMRRNLRGGSDDHARQR